jgi:hypothetical protein
MTWDMTFNHLHLHLQNLMIRFSRSKSIMIIISLICERPRFGLFRTWCRLNHHMIMTRMMMAMIIESRHAPNTCLLTPLTVVDHFYATLKGPRCFKMGLSLTCASVEFPSFDLEISDFMLSTRLHLVSSSLVQD